MGNFESRRPEPTKTFIFSKNYPFGYHQNHLKVFGCLDSCFCVLMWITIEIFTNRQLSPGSSDMEKSLQSCCGPFRELQKWSNMVKLRQIGQNIDFLSLLMYFRFVFVFSFFFGYFFVFVSGSCCFFSFLNQIWQHPKIAKNLEFFQCFFHFVRFFFSIYFHFLFEFFSNYFRTEQTLSIDFQIIFESQKNNFQIISN